MLLAETDQYPAPRILLNSNESAFGPSVNAVNAATAAAADLFRYLENPASRLAPALAQRYQVDQKRLTVGNGSDDLLARLARVYLEPGTEMIRSKNGYLKAPNYAFANGAEPISVEDDDLKPSVDNILAAVTDKTRMVYLANPENPAGTYLSGSEIRRLHQSLPGEVLLVLDCAYEEYVDAEDYESGQLLASIADNVVMTRTFSKIHGLAGARVGWMLAAPEIIDLVNRIGLTFPLASCSVAAALAALKDKHHQKTVFEINRKLRQQFSEKMTHAGLKVYPSQTNFQLLKFENPDKTAIGCEDYLLKRGIVIRRLASPAYQDCIRVTIGLESQMKIATEAITSYLNA